ncbi:MAG: hypothetical protein ACREBS_04575 [Nitrososphaerales archaeon]
MAYFTDPMGDEFKKAIEEAFRDMGNDPKKRKKSVKRKKSATQKRGRTSKMKRLSKKMKESLR